MFGFGRQAAIVLGGIGAAVLSGCGGAGLGRAVYADKAFQHRFHTVRQGLIGHVHIGPDGIAAMRRQSPGEQHRAHWRSFQIGGVGVPQPAEIQILVGPLENRNDVGKVRQSLNHRIGQNVGEVAGEVEELLQR